MRFAFITPRYGADVSTGAEHACRLLAEQACRRHDIEVLTTTARDPATWQNEFSEGADRIRRVLVRRFAVSGERSTIMFDRLSRNLAAGPRSREDEHEWVRHRGPSSTGLLEYLSQQQRSFDALVFFGLWHPLTVQGLEIAPQRSVLFPYVQLHDALRFDLWADMLLAPRALGYFSDAERRLVHSYIGVTPQHEDLIGIGVDAPVQSTYPRHQQDPADAITGDDELPPEDEESADDLYLASRGAPFSRRHRLHGPFVLYPGRVEPNNGCEEMLEYFDTYATGADDPALVLMGVKMLKVPESPHVRLAGVLPDRERMTACEAAIATIAPAPDDLLSQTLLESLAVGTPVLASARNRAAVDHCRRSNGGLYYANREEFVAALTEIVRTPGLRERLGDSGRRYVRQHHQWEQVIGRFEHLVSRVRSR